MKFYTYNYLLSRIEVTNWLQIFFIVLATSILLFGVFKYYKEKKQSKYRELSLIALFLVLIMIGIRINDIQIHKARRGDYSSSGREVLQSDLCGRENTFGEDGTLSSPN